MLGNFVYFDPTITRFDTTLPPQPCGVLPKPGRSSAVLRWSVPKPLRINTGGDITTNVTFRNTSLRAIRFESGDPITGVVTRRGSDTIIARYNGAIGGVGFGGTLSPGNHPTVTGLVSTASCDATLGYALPPGRYEVRVPVVVLTDQGSAPTKVEYILSEADPLTIVP